MKEIENKISLYKNNYEKIIEQVAIKATECKRSPQEIKVLAVSKTHNYDVINMAIEAGIPLFAENYAQEFRDKNMKLIEYYEQNNIQIPKFEWHFIGHLQTNKVKYLVPFVTTIHTVDRIGLAEEINKQAAKYSKKIDVLIQINTSGETSKSGIAPDECNEIVKKILMLKNINLLGLMTIGTFSDDEKVIRKEFSILRSTLEDVNYTNGIELKELSMGMSHDFEIAIEEKSTMLRIGTAIFGNR